MRIVQAFPEDFAVFMSFQQKVYKNDKNFRNLQKNILPDILRGRSAITRGSRLVPYMLLEGNELLGVFMLAVMDRMTETMQIAFLDFKDHPHVFSAIYDFSKKEAGRAGCKKLLVGLNIHVNYGLGILADSFDFSQSFGDAYHKAYYRLRIEELLAPSDILYTYRIRIRDMQMGLSPGALERIRCRYKVREADFSRVREMTLIYSKINNAAFSRHKYYYPTRVREDMELFSSFRALLSGHNLLFVYHGEEPVGFLLWYPDFNQIVKPGKGVGIGTVLKQRLLPGSIDTLRIAEFGIIPAHQKKGAVYALLEYLYEGQKDRYTYVESGWVMEENLDSKGVVKRFMKYPYKEFRVYEEVLGP